MTASLFSPSWHRVAALTPKLRTHVRVHRHHYRGELWYVLEDPSSQRAHRFTPAANFIIGQMDGRRSVQQIWDMATANLGDDAPTQDEMIRLLSQLHSSDTLQCDVPPDTSELLQRYHKQKSSAWKRRFLNPMALRIPLIDPDTFLKKSMAFVRPMFGWAGVSVWLGVVFSALVAAAMHWPDLTENITDRVLAPHNLLILWLTFPVIKALHEFGHAYATKVWGGEVHEMGIMFLVLMPIPYVDATAASSFREKYKRVIVGAAGMIVEMFIAALALFVWLLIEPGMARSIAYNVIIIASVSTVLFNANPLLRFDGYYIFADYIEIQNLGTRSTKYLGYLVQRYLFGLRSLEPPLSTKGERYWFAGYGVASFVYRMFVVVLITLFVATQFFFIGILLALWALVIMVIVPTVKNISKIFTQSSIAPKRARAIASTSGIALAVIGFITLVPVPSWTRAEGVVWVEGDAIVRPDTDGFVRRVIAQPGESVNRGDPLIELENVELLTHVKVLWARLDELDALYTAQLQSDRVQADITNEEINATRAELARAKEEAQGLLLRSKIDGTFVVPSAQDLPGRFVRKGDVMAYTLDLAAVTMRVVVPQDDIEMVRHRTKTVDVRLVDRLVESQTAVIKREVPAATDQLPSLALSQQGGGQIAMDPLQKNGARAFQKFFILEIAFPIKSQIVNIGSRIYVRFDHGYEPMASQWYRSIRQLFLARFNV